MAREYATVASKISPELYTQMLNYCERKGLTPSSFVKLLIESEIAEVIPIHKAGMNEIEYSKKGDSFTWKIKYDDGKEATVATDISFLFLENVTHAFTRALKERDLYLNKGKEHSVPAPTKIRRVVK